MRMEIQYKRRFRNQYRNADKEIKAAFAHTLELFVEDPHHASLRKHPLTGRFAGYRSIDVTGDWRAIFTVSVVGERRVAIFHLLGTHDTLYG